MAFASLFDRASKARGDVFDQILGVAWILSDIAVDVFGMFFWAAIALFLLAAIS
jgi:hypothetical protein